MEGEAKAAFGYNNKIIRSFRMGWVAPVRGCLRLLPPAVWVGLLAVLLGAAVLVVHSR